MKVPVAIIDGETVFAEKRDWYIGKREACKHTKYRDVAMYGARDLALYQAGCRKVFCELCDRVIWIRSKTP